VMDPALDKQKKLESRRSFLRNATIGVLGFGAASYGDSAVESKNGNVETVEGEHGTHTVLFNRHYVPLETSVLDSADYLVLEGSDIRYRDGDTGTQKIIEFLSSYEPYRALILEAARQNKPVYFVDSSINLVLDALTDFAGLTTLGTAETGLGLLAAEIAHNPKKYTETRVAKMISRQLSPPEGKPDGMMGMARRGMLRAGLAGLAAYLVTPALHYASVLNRAVWGKHDDKEALSTIVGHKLQSFNAVVHPEFTTVTFEGRNAIIAQKAETLASLISSNLGRKARSCIVIGGGHKGIVDELQKSENKRLQRIAGILDTRMEGEKYILRMDPTLVPGDDQQFTSSFTLSTDLGFEQYAYEHHKYAVVNASAGYEGRMPLSPEQPEKLR